VVEITIPKPDDWHLHLRDGAMLEGVLPFSARHFARAIIMPNLVPPVVTSADAKAYRDRIMAAVPSGLDFTPLMTLYLTEGTDPADVASAHASGLVTAVKLYPAGATTNSHSGVRDLSRVMPVLEKMAEIGMPLCIHGEVTDPAVDIFDREAVFIETVLDPLRRNLPELRITLEHITTSNGIDYVMDSTANLAGSITTHHLMINRNAILAGGIKPHYYCLPVAKRESHRLALRKAATSGDRRFFWAPIPPRMSIPQGMRLRLCRHLYLDQHPVVPRPRFRGRQGPRQTGRIREPQRPGLVRTAGQQRDRDTGPARRAGESWPDRSRPATGR
jgi:dihydroorotase